MLVAAMMLLFVPSAQASFGFTAPAERSFLTPGADLEATFAAQCPEGMTCGTWSTSRVYDTVRFTLDHATFVPGDAGYFGDTYGVYSYSGGTMKLDVDDAITAGMWKLQAKWQECPPAALVSGGPGEAACTSETITRTLRVRPTIGNKQVEPMVASYSVRGKPNLLRTDLYVGCNAPASKYRFDFTVQKQVRINKRMRWVPMARKVRNLRVKQDKISTIPRCFLTRGMMLPAKMKATDRFRVQFVGRTVGFAPAAKPRTIYSKVYTRRSLPASGGGGSVTIGS
jgi:hypothetical protein